MVALKTICMPDAAVQVRSRRPRPGDVFERALVHPGSIAAVLSAGERPTVDSRRRRFTLLALLQAPTALLLGGIPWTAGAATARLPAVVRSLDDAGMALFDAAETADWAGAGQALDRAKAAALQIDGLKWPFVQAGGAIGRFIEVQNNLGADLGEADLALSTKDQRWLISSADRIDSRAGELSQPFLNRSDRLAARVDTLLYLARRMRRALIWHDDAGYRQASDDFTSVAKPLLHELRGQTAARSQALASALKGLGSSPTSAELKSLQAALHVGQRTDARTASG